MFFKNTITQAKTLGYSYQHRDEEVHQILPCQTEESWTLIYNVKDFRWILSVNDVPQLILSDADAMAFLKRRAFIYSRV